MEITVVDQLNEAQVKKLYEMYQNEWFTKGRVLKDIKEMLLHTDFVFGFCKNGSNELIGFARVISDHVYKAFVFDVIVDQDYREKGLGKFIVDNILNHPTLKHVSHIECYCPEKLVPFYQKWDFKPRTSLLLRREM